MRLALKCLHFYLRVLIGPSSSSRCALCSPLARAMCSCVFRALHRQIGGDNHQVNELCRFRERAWCIFETNLETPVRTGIWTYQTGKDAEWPLFLIARQHAGRTQWLPRCLWAVRLYVTEITQSGRKIGRCTKDARSWFTTLVSKCEYLFFSNLIFTLATRGIIFSIRTTFF